MRSVGVGGVLLEGGGLLERRASDKHGPSAKL
jgi:hypothetical protein